MFQQLLTVSYRACRKEWETRYNLGIYAKPFETLIGSVNPGVIRIRVLGWRCVA